MLKSPSTQPFLTMPRFRFALSRAYKATSKGKSDTYSQDYFREDGTVAQWREPRRIPTDDNAWVEELQAHLEQMAKLGPDMAFEIGSIDYQIEATAYAYAHKSGERFGAREYDSLIDKVRGTELVGKSEIRVMRPMMDGVAIPKRSMMVAGNGLEVQHSYHLLGEETPLMPSLSGGTLEDLAAVVRLPAGTVVTVKEIAFQAGDPWYHVSLPDYGGRKGWINSIALLRDGAQRLEGERQHVATVPTETEAKGHLPPACESSSNPPPDWLRCPTPYVEMVPENRDDIFERNWYCREKEYSLGLVRGGGCGSSYLTGWSLPVPEGTVAADYHSEIVASVVNPCILGIARSHPEFAAMRDQELVELVRTTNPNAWDEITQVTLSVVTGKDAAARLVVYELFLAECIRAGTSGP